MKSLGARFARCVNRVCQRTGRVLASRFHHVVKRTPTEVRNALAIVDKSVVRGTHRGTEQFGSGFGMKGLHLGAVLNDQVGDVKMVRLYCVE
ncbi:MAG: hypothetical protein OXU77_04635 [Gammaproteobacteria bacterium]|nr:hypothetical protein [Gammaproteobacteria bacterium]MDE0443083.1 hypothetical protein [Gammaproteobacteria bacterium]